MTWKERVAITFGIWLCVYPSVLAMSWLLDATGWNLPMWLEILISTAVSVPLISFVAVPTVKKVVTAAEAKPVEALSGD